MTRSFWRTLLALAAVAALLGISACGGDDSESSDSGTPATSEEGAPSGGESVTDQLFAGTALDNIKDPAQGKKGGKLTVLSSGDVDYMDPGKTYYTYAIGIMNAIHRGLYTYTPQDSAKPVPDLAEGDPEISADGKTVTVKIKKGVMFSKPVSREVEAKDVKYALERAFTANVTNGYARVYLGDIKGVPEEAGDYQEIPGIETPDKYTIVLKLTQGTGAAAAGALAMPISVPVPKEFAQKYDKETPSTYGEQAAVYTGPYMVESDAEGKATGYVAGKTIKLVRNPDYTPVDDFRPAYLDEIEFQAGNDDTAVATRRILSGENLAGGDIEPPARQLKTLLESNKTDLSAVPGGGWRMISMDTSKPPFDDINVRKAVIAGFNRNAARQQRGGEALGPIAQGYIPPGMAGFEESGGIEGFTAEQDWMAKPEGDRALSSEYFKKAGMTSGKYEGGEEILIVGDNADPDKSIAQITEQQLNEMGFKTKLRLVTRDTMFTKFCNVPDSDVSVCPSVGWSKDFADAQTMLDPTFNGENIIPSRQLELARAERAGDQQGDRRREARHRPGRARSGLGRREQDDHGSGAGDPLHVGLPGHHVSPNMRGVQNGYSTTWDWNFTSVEE